MENISNKIEQREKCCVEYYDYGNVLIVMRMTYKFKLKTTNLFKQTITHRKCNE